MSNSEPLVRRELLELVGELGQLKENGLQVGWELSSTVFRTIFYFLEPLLMKHCVEQ